MQAKEMKKMGKSSLATISVPAYSGNYTQGRRGNKISKITVHHMAGVMSATQCGALWQSGNGQDTFSHRTWNRGM